MSPSRVALDSDEPPARGGGRVPGDFDPGDDFFLRRREPFGALMLRLLVGPLRFDLTGLSADQHGSLLDRFRPFRDMRPEGEPPDLAIRFAPAGVAAFLASPCEQAEIYRMGRRLEGSRMAIWSYEFAGSIDAAERRADLALVDGAGPAFDRGVENFLRVLTAHFILGRGGLLVHGAGVVREGRAHVFFGPSGSGKTTVTRLSPGDTVLSDDLTLVVPDGGGYAAAGIPFGMAHHVVPGTAGCFPIAGLYRLAQSPSVRLDLLPRALALAELTGCLPFVMQETASATAALAIATDVVSSIPVHRLLFRRDPSFWDVAQEASGA